MPINSNNLNLRTRYPLYSGVGTGSERSNKVRLYVIYIVSRIFSMDQWQLPGWISGISAKNNEV